MIPGSSFFYWDYTYNILIIWDTEELFSFLEGYGKVTKGSYQVRLCTCQDFNKFVLGIQGVVVFYIGYASCC